MSVGASCDVGSRCSGLKANKNSCMRLHFCTPESLTEIAVCNCGNFSVQDGGCMPGNKKISINSEVLNMNLATSHV